MNNYQLKQSFQVTDSENGMIHSVIHRDEDFIVLKTADNPDPLFLYIKAAVLIAEAINQLAKIKP